MTTVRDLKEGGRNIKVIISTFYVSYLLYVIMIMRMMMIMMMWTPR